jgi:hypothetical protein
MMKVKTAKAWAWMGGDGKYAPCTGKTRPAGSTGRKVRIVAESDWNKIMRCMRELDARRRSMSIAR